MTKRPTLPGFLVGRTAPLAECRELLDGARDGEGSAAVIYGEPGVGKTELTRAAVEDAADFLILRCRGVQSEAELPFSGLHQLLLPLLPTAGGLAESQQDALRGAFAMDDADAGSTTAVSMAALTLIAHAAESQPVLLLVDDLHWIDAATLPVLAFVARRVGHDRVLMLLTSLPGEVVDQIEARRIELLPLSVAETGVLARRLTSGPLPDEVVDALASATGGNPLAVIETVRLLGDDLDLLGSQLDDPPPVGELIRRGFASRLSDLPDETQAALAVVAAALEDSAEPVHAALGELALPVTALDPAESGGIITRDPGRITFSHPLLRALVHHDTPAIERRRCHRALAAVVADRGARAWHAASASETADAEIAAELEAAALGFQQRGGYLAAARALERSARLTPSRERRAERLLLASEAASRTGRFPWALAIADEAYDLSDGDDLKMRLELRLELRRIILTARIGVDAEPPYARCLRLAVDAAAAGHPANAADALTFLVLELITVGRIDDARAAVQQIRALGPVTNATVADEVSGSVGVFLIVSGDDPAEGRRLLLEAGQRRLINPRDGQDYIAEVLIWIEQYDLAEQLLASTIGAGRDTGDLNGLASGLTMDAMRRYRLGDWSGADAAFRESRYVAETIDQPWFGALGTALLANLHAGRGDASARDLVGHAESLAVSDERQMLEPYFASALGLLELTCGNAEQAVAQLKRASAWASNAGIREPGMLPWPADLVEAHVLAGQLPQAREALEWLRERADATGRVWARAAVARLDGLLAPTGYDGHFEEAIALCRELPAPFDLARTQLHYGRRLRRSGDRTNAVEQLESALQGFEALGAAPWVEQTQAELRAAGVSLDEPSNTHPPLRQPLTSQEICVADCVAQGMTNKQIAAQLYLTPKTIEWHLRGIFRKLGIRSRVQLAQYMSGAPPQS